MFSLKKWVRDWQTSRHPNRTTITRSARRRSMPLALTPLEDRTVPAATTAIIGNGTIQLGVNYEGHLNVSGGSLSSGGTTTAVGLRYLATNAESTAPGCLCEGWGVADVANGKAGYANVSIDGGPQNLSRVSFTNTASTAISVVDVVGTGLRVTHDYHPSPATPNLYEVTVTIENRGTTDISDLRYRRVMDWDIEPTPFSEYVTIQGWGTGAPALFRTDNNGFNSANPLSFSSFGLQNLNFVDAGPRDHGALFDFGLGKLAAGAKNSINIFYGAAGNETGALSALAAVNSKVYSLGQPSTTGGPTLGTPNTFIFGFSGFHVDAVNRPPVANNDTAVTDRNVSVNIPTSALTANDTDPDFDTLTVTGVSPTSANGGTVSLSGTTVTYTPATNFAGTDSFTYSISDGHGGTATGTVSVTVRSTNRAPVANPDLATTAEDTAVGINVLANDSDPDGDTLRILSWTTPLHGSVVLHQNGTPTNTADDYLVYTPDPNYHGEDGFSYTIEDSGVPPLTASTTGRVRINPVNDAPVAVGESYAVDEDTLLSVGAPGVLGNDSDVDGDLLKAIVVTGPAHGTLSLNLDGSFSYTPDANYNGPDSFVYKADDSYGGTATATVSITVRPINDAPVAMGPHQGIEMDEDTVLSGVSVNATDVDGDTLTYVLVHGPAHGTLSLNPSTGSFTYTPDANYYGDDHFEFKATDGLLESNVAEVHIIVHPVNDAPVLGAIGNKTVDEGSPLTFTAAATDVDLPPDTLTYSLVGAPAGATIDPTTGAFSWTPPDNGSFTFTVRVTDDGSPNLSDDEAITVTVNNVAPTAVAGPDRTVNEGAMTSFDLGSFADPGADNPWAVTVDWGDGGSTTFDATAPGALGAASHAYADNGTYTVTVKVKDKDGAEGSDTFQVTVNNVAPTVSAITAPLDPVAVNTAIGTSATFADVGVNDTHTATWDWGDGSTSAGTVTESGGSGSVTGSHTYAAAGVYTVTLTVTDQDGGSVTTVFQYVVVYDVGAGFVTGGGWIDSPAGAYAADPTATGKANFGFVSKYQKGATTPTGQTEFQFKAGGLNFHSSSYDWLVVSGAKAQYKGTGTVNGVSGYKFMLTATDGELAGGGGVDKFRIKIWHADTGAVVYDNQQGASDTDDPLTALGGGSIKIHS